MTLMKALVKAKPEPGIWLQTVKKPTIKAHEILIKIKKTAICGTDLHYYNWDIFAQNTVKTPMHIGHEFVGEIVEIGENNSQNLKIGDRVSGEGHLICGNCRNCRAGAFHLCPNTQGIGSQCPGAFAEYLALPAFNVFKLPEYISDDIASILDPFGNATHTVLSFDLIGEDVLITGAGPIGCIAAAICKKAGAKSVTITDINDYRLNLAIQMGADVAINVLNCQNLDAIKQKISASMKQLGITEGFDVGLEMSGVESSINTMVELLVNGGKIALLGLSSTNINVNWNQIVLKCLHLKGIYGREMFETWYKMTAMVKSGLNIDNIITHRLSINDYITGFELMKSGKCGKVILDWSDLN